MGMAMRLKQGFLSFSLLGGKYGMPNKIGSLIQAIALEEHTLERGGGGCYTPYLPSPDKTLYH